MVVWVQNPFDSLPGEGSRKMRFWLMCEAFARAGHRVTFWTSDFSHATKAPRRFVGDPSDGAAFDVRLIPTRPYARNVGWARVLSHRAYARAWRRLATAPGVEAPDLIITSVPTLSAADAALALGRHFGARVVLDVMDAWPETFERLAPRALRPLAHLLLAPLRRKARRLYRAADLVTGVCARYRELTGRADYHLAYHGIEVEKWKSGKVEKKWNGGEVERLKGEGLGRGWDFSTPPPFHHSTFSPFHLSTSSSLRLVYAGNLGRTYDLATVVAAVRAHPELELDVAGFGSFACDCPRVRMHGLLSEADLQTLLAAADVGVIPMAADSWVGVPYKFCDYARAGLAIVSSLGGESTELLERYRCGVAYRAGDVDSFADAVRRAASLERGASRRMCEEVFDATRIYDDYVRRACCGIICGMEKFATDTYTLENPVF